MEKLKEAARSLICLPDGLSADDALKDFALEWACQQLLRYTLGRAEACGEAEPPPSSMTHCAAELAVLWICGHQNSGRTVVRESVGSWAKTWSADASSLQDRCTQIVRQWLGSEDGLLYRGVD